MTTRPSPAAPILAALAIALVPLAAYVSGYFWLGEYSDLNLYGRYRVFANDPLKTLYGPMACLESHCTGNHVTVMSFDEWGDELDGIISAPPIADPEA